MMEGYRFSNPDPFTSSFDRKPLKGSNMSVNSNLVAGSNNYNIGSNSTRAGILYLMPTSSNPSTGHNIFRPAGRISHALTDDTLAQALTDPRYPVESLKEYHDLTMGMAFPRLESSIVEPIMTRMSAPTPPAPASSTPCRPPPTPLPATASSAMPPVSPTLLSEGWAKLGGQKLVVVMRMEPPEMHHCGSSVHVTSNHWPQLRPELNRALLSHRRRMYLTHGAGGVTAAVEGGVGTLPGTSRIDVGDAGHSRTEEGEESSGDSRAEENHAEVCERERAVKCEDVGVRGVKMVH